MIDHHAKNLFTVAAVFNAVVGATFLVAMPQFAQLIQMKPVPSDPLFGHLSAVLVLTFGWGYWRIACDPIANRPIIHMGVLGKSLVVIACFYDWLSGNTNWPFALLVSGDAVFAALFVDYLHRHPVRKS